MFNNPYIQRGFNQQNMYEQIDNQINQLQQMKDQMKNNQQQPAINQTFQLAPTNNHTMRYANTIEDVKKETVYYETPFFSKDMSVAWIKSPKGDIKAYALAEIIEKDEKDIKIEFLQAQIEELKKGMVKNESINEYVDEPITDEKSTSIKTIRRNKKG